MTNTNVTEKKVQTQATYTITVSSHLTLEELTVNFHPNLITTNIIEIHNSTESTELVVDNIELVDAEWLDESKNV